MNNAYANELPKQKSLTQLEQEKASLLSELSLINLEINRQRQKPVTSK